MAPARLTLRNGVPFSSDFDDVYHSGDGIAERERVFIDGNDLRQRFAQLRPGHTFALAELGFGTGLSVLLAARAFEALAPAGTLLHVTSFEARPLTANDLERLVPVRRPIAAGHARLRAVHPPPLPGWHRRWLTARVVLSLFFGDAADGLSQLVAAGTRSQDAWFLDGFAPARNPAMFAAATLTQVARLSHAATTLASFTVAGTVRRTLADCGFSVERVDGSPLKRHYLRARFRGSPAPPTPGPRSVTIVGAGIAGAALARALAARGVQVRVLDSGIGVNGHAVGGGTLPAAALHVRASRDARVQLLRANALGCSASLLRDLPGWFACGRLDVGAVAVDCPWPAMPVDGRLGASLAGIAGPAAGNFWRGGGFAALPTLIAHLCRDVEPIATSVHTIAAADSGWQLQTSAGTFTDDTVIVAAPAFAATMPPLAARLRSLGGTLTLFRTRLTPRTVIGGQGYVAPVGAGLVASAGTYEHGAAWDDARTDAENAARLRAFGLPPIAVASRFRGLRYGTADRLPMVGAVANGLLVSTAFASSGLALAPLAAEIIASDLLREAPAVNPDVSAALAPLRATVRPARIAAR